MDHDITDKEVIDASRLVQVTLKLTSMTDNWKPNSLYIIVYTV